MTKIDNYVIHNVYYYETDQMRVVHHANYVRWMEEARINFFKKLKIDFNDIEKKELYLAVISQNVDYLKPVFFNDEIKITCSCTKLSCTRVEFTYEIINNKNNQVCAKGKTCHCFVNSKYEPIVFQKELKDVYLTLKTIEGN